MVEVKVTVHTREPGGDWQQVEEVPVNSWWLLTLEGWTDSEVRHANGTSVITIKRDKQ